jgi:hypothetical protein
MGGLTHADTQGFSLSAAGDGTAVVVTQDHQRGLAELGLKDLLATGIEIVAVNEGEHGEPCYEPLGVLRQ